MKIIRPEDKRFVKVEAESGLSKRSMLLIRSLCLAGKVSHVWNGDTLVVDMNSFENYRSSHAM